MGITADGVNLDAKLAKLQDPNNLPGWKGGMVSITSLGGTGIPARLVHVVGEQIWNGINLGKSSGFYDVVDPYTGKIFGNGCGVGVRADWGPIKVYLLRKGGTLIIAEDTGRRIDPKDWNRFYDRNIFVVGFPVDCQFNGIYGANSLNDPRVGIAVLE